MALRTRREYLKAIQDRYRRASRKAKTIILNEVDATCFFNRKYAIRLLREQSSAPAFNLV